MRPRLLTAFPFLRGVLSWTIPKFLDFSDYKRTRSRIKNLELQVSELQNRLHFEKQIDQYYFELLILLRPEVEVNNEHLVRVGSSHDGGYLVPRDSSFDSRWVTFGLGTNLDFELELASNNCIIDSFDHTLVQRPKISYGNFTYHKKGIGPTSTSNFITLSELSSKLKLHIATWHLKLDVEGAEWDVFDQITEINNPPQVIICEVHGLSWSKDERHNGLRILRLKKLLNRYDVLSLNGNNFSPNMVSSMTEIHDVVELTLRLKSKALSEPKSVGFTLENHQNDPNGPRTRTTLLLKNA